MRINRNTTDFSFDHVYVSDTIFRFISGELSKIQLPSSSYTCHDDIVMLETASLACINNEPLMACLKNHIAVDMSSLLKQHCIFIVSRK
ncbi:hypothetical protein EL09_15380 [Salmonella enterica subsp. enterica]|nr:hypothetical protein [Salmonella enterica subsp. enterica]